MNPWPAALDAAPVATAVLRDGRVIYVNRAAIELAGLPAEELLGRRFLDFVASEDAARVLERQERRLRGEGAPAVYEASLVGGGRRRRVQVHAAVSDGDVVVQLIDVTGEGARHMRLAALAQLGALVQRQLREEDVMRTVREALEALGLESAVLRPERDGLHVASGWVEPARLARLEAAYETSFQGALLPWTPLSRQAWAQGAAFVDDWLQEARRQAPGPLPPEDEAAARSLTAIFVRVDLAGQPAALIMTVGPWLRPGDLPAFRLFGAQMSGALDAARTVDELSRRNAELGAINRVGEAAGTSPDLERFLARSCHEVAGAVGAPLVALHVFDRERGEARLLYLHGAGEVVRQAFSRSPLEAFAPVARDGEVRVREASAYGAALQAQLARAGVETVVTVPIRFRSAVVGALSAGYGERRDPAACRPELLQAMGAHFAAALETHRLLDDLRGRVSELTLLNDIAVATAALDPVLLLENALRRVGATFRAEAAAAYVVEGTDFVQVACFGVSPETAERHRRMSLATGEVGRAFAERKAVHFPDLSRSMPPLAIHWAEGLLAAVAVPLLVKDRVLGAFLLGRRRPEAFGEDELSLLSAIGVQLGVAVENARLFADTRRRVSDLEAVNALALRVFGTTPGDARGLLEAACREIAQALSTRSALMLQLDAAGAGLTGTAGWGAAAGGAEPGRSLAHSELAARALRTQEPVWGLLPDVPAPGELAAPPLSVLFVPLTSRRATRGLVALIDDPRRRYSDAEVALAYALASEAAMGLENAELYAEARGRVEELSLLNEVGRSVAGSLDLARVLSEGARAVRQILGATHGHVFLLDPERRELRMGATTLEGDAELAALREPLDGQTLPALAARERRPMVVHDTAEPGGADVATAVRHGARALAAAPLLFRDQSVGVLVVSQYGAPRRFTPAEVERVMAVANQLAVAIDNARLFDETRRRAEELGVLLEVGRSLVATLELDQVLDAGVRNLARMVQATDAGLFLADARGEQLVCRAVAGGAPGLLGRTLPLDGGEPSLAREAFLDGRPVTVEDGEHDPRVNPAFRSLVGTRAHLALPLLVRERRIGAAVLVDSRGPRRFTPAEVERAAAVANQLAVAVEHARLYEDLRRSYADLAHAQHQLVHRERLAALGELAAVVAHEVRNPLGVIFNSLGSLRRMLRPEGDAKMLLEIVGEEADRLNRIVGDLLDFARPSPPTLRPEPLDRVLDEALSTALAEARGPVEVRRAVPADLPLVPMDARLVRQAVLNVALNSVQAMPDGGTLDVRARVQGAEAVLELEDSGPGIPEEVRHRIFEPFFTTKATGTGLGLAVVKRILDGHRGRVEVTSRPGAGTLFALFLPLAAPPPLAAGAGVDRGWVA